MRKQMFCRGVSSLACNLLHSLGIGLQLAYLAVRLFELLLVVGNLLAQHVYANPARMAVQEAVFVHYAHNEHNEEDCDDIFVPAHEEPGGMYFAHRMTFYIFVQRYK